MNARRRPRRTSRAAGYPPLSRRAQDRWQSGPFLGPLPAHGRGRRAGRTAGRGGPVYVPVHGWTRRDRRAAQRTARSLDWNGDRYGHGTGPAADGGRPSRSGHRRPGESFVARSPEWAARAAWRYRWQLAPVAGAVGVLAAATLTPAAALVTCAGLAGIAGAAWRWAAAGSAIRGRMLLSVLERRCLAGWAAAAAAWSLWAATPLPGGGSPWLLAAGTAYPAVRWGRSRRVRPVHRLSPSARAVVDRWTEAVALRGPGPLQGSRIIRSTMREPAEGAYTFTVQLAPGVHGKDAATDAGRRGVEVELRLPVDTAALAPDRDDASRMHVTLTPSRHLETAPPEWESPELADDGTMPIADTPDGVRVPIAIYNEDGVEHLFIVGTSGAGKSSTTATIALPGPAAGIETLWYVDGKEGGSAPYLAPAIDWYAITPEQWGQVIDATHAVLNERKRRRAGKHRWHTPTETDPVLTVLIDEATTVANRLSSARHGKVLELLREGRTLGVRVIQVAQDPMGTDLLGGRKARDLMVGNGAMLAHRPGGSLAARIALDSTSNRTVDLTGLPPEPGFLAVIRRGRVLAPVARVRHCTPEKAAGAAAGITPRPLGSADAEAAGTAYVTRRQTPRPAYPVPAPRTETTPAPTPPVPGGTPAEPETVVRLARDVVAETLAGLDRPVTRGWLAHRTGLAPATVTKALAELEEEERAERVRGQRWRAIP
jgi:hypothetical protein